MIPIDFFLQKIMDLETDTRKFNMTSSEISIGQYRYNYRGLSMGEGIMNASIYITAWIMNDEGWYDQV